MRPVIELHPLRYRAIWISDVHLGTRGCRADFLIDLLRTTELECLNLVRDIVDVLAMKRATVWTPAQNAVVHLVLGKAAEGTRVIEVLRWTDRRESLAEFPARRRQRCPAVGAVA